MFIPGKIYTRKTIGEICYPGEGRPAGGNWDTGYVRINRGKLNDNLMVFMNIGVPGVLGHDFDNHFDPQNHLVTWYGKPRTHSGQPLMRGIIAGEIPLHLFARWDQYNPDFTYLGVGSVLSYKDQVETQAGRAMEFKLFVESALTILTHTLPTQNEAEVNAVPPLDVPDDPLPISTSFALEKHLEDHICRNWESTPFGRDYEIYDGGRGRQYQTPTGPLDILALRNDEQEFLVLELKRGRTGNAVIGQVSTYMGHIRREFNREVRGGIIASGGDPQLDAAIAGSPNIDFYQYIMTFSMHQVG